MLEPDSPPIEALSRWNPLSDVPWVMVLALVKLYEVGVNVSDVRGLTVTVVLASFRPIFP